MWVSGISSLRCVGVGKGGLLKRMATLIDIDTLALALGRIS
jgi:hypothetical protein